RQSGADMGHGVHRGGPRARGGADPRERHRLRVGAPPRAPAVRGTRPRRSLRSQPARRARPVTALPGILTFPATVCGGSTCFDVEDLQMKLTVYLAGEIHTSWREG